MLKNKLIYLAVVITASVFFILYRDRLALILFLSVLAITLLLFLIALIMRLGLRLAIECNQKVIFSGNTAKILVNIKNYSFLPITQIIVKSDYKNNLLSNFDNGNMTFYSRPFSEEKYEIELSSKHYGNVDMYFKEAKVTDYFGVFSFKLKLKKKFTLTFLPTRHQIETSLRQNMYTLSEATVYSKHKPGDDPSEVFAIRDYIDGDKLNRIHWKLSSKQEKFMVKDYSLPISEAVLLLPELTFSSEKDIYLIDSVLEILVSLSSSYIEKNTIHYIGWYHSDVDAVAMQKIESIDDLYAVIGSMFSNEYYSEPKLASVDDDLQRDMSHIVYLSPNLTQNQCEILNRSKSSLAFYTAINVVENSNTVNVNSDDVNIITVVQGKVSDCLNGVEF